MAFGDRIKKAFKGIGIGAGIGAIACAAATMFFPPAGLAMWIMWGAVVGGSAILGAIGGAVSHRRKDGGVSKNSEVDPKNTIPDVSNGQADVVFEKETNRRIHNSLAGFNKFHPGDIKKMSSSKPEPDKLKFTQKSIKHTNAKAKETEESTNKICARDDKHGSMGESTRELIREKTILKLSDLHQEKLKPVEGELHKLIVEQIGKIFTNTNKGINDKIYRFSKDPGDNEFLNMEGILNGQIKLAIEKIEEIREKVSLSDKANGLCDQAINELQEARGKILSTYLQAEQLVKGFNERGFQLSLGGSIPEVEEIISKFKKEADAVSEGISVLGDSCGIIFTPVTHTLKSITRHFVDYFRDKAKHLLPRHIENLLKEFRENCEKGVNALKSENYLLPRDLGNLIKSIEYSKKKVPDEIELLQSHYDEAAKNNRKKMELKIFSSAKKEVSKLKSISDQCLRELKKKFRAVSLTLRFDSIVDEVINNKKDLNSIIKEIGEKTLKYRKMLKKIFRSDLKNKLFVDAHEQLKNVSAAKILIAQFNSAMKETLKEAKDPHSEICDIFLDYKQRLQRIFKVNDLKNPLFANAYQKLEKIAKVSLKSLKEASLSSSRASLWRGRTQSCSVEEKEQRPRSPSLSYNEQSVE